MARGEEWATTAYRALFAMGGEASEADILRWTQDNRSSLRHGWQSNLVLAIRQNADSLGKGLFQPVEGSHGLWRLSGTILTTRTTDRLPGDKEVPTIAKAVAGALARADAHRLPPLDAYLLAVIAYEMDWYVQALRLLDTVAEGASDVRLQEKAKQLKSVVSAKLGIIMPLA